MQFQSPEMNLYASEDIDVFTTIGDSILNIDGSNIMPTENIEETQLTLTELGGMDFDRLTSLAEETLKKNRVGDGEGFLVEYDEAGVPIRKMRRVLDVDDLLVISDSKDDLRKVGKEREKVESISSSKAGQSDGTHSSKTKQKKRPLSASFSIKPLIRTSVGPVSTPETPKFDGEKIAQGALANRAGASGSQGRRRMSLQDFFSSRKRRDSFRDAFLNPLDPSASDAASWFEERGFWVTSGISIPQDIDQVLTTSSELIEQLGIEEARKALKLPGEDDFGAGSRRLKDVDEFLALPVDRDSRNVGFSNDGEKKGIHDRVDGNRKADETYYPWTQEGATSIDIGDMLDLGGSLSKEFFPLADTAKDDVGPKVAPDIDLIMSLADLTTVPAVGSSEPIIGKVQFLVSNTTANDINTNKEDLKSRFLASVNGNSNNSKNIFKQHASSPDIDIKLGYASTPNLSTWRTSVIGRENSIKRDLKTLNGGENKDKKEVMGGYFHSTGMLAIDAHYGHHGTQPNPNDFDIDNFLEMGSLRRKNSRNAASESKTPPKRLSTVASHPKGTLNPQLESQPPRFDHQCDIRARIRTTTVERRAELLSAASLDASELMEIGENVTAPVGASHSQYLGPGGAYQRDRIKSTTGTFHSHVSSALSKASGGTGNSGGSVLNGILFRSVPARLDAICRSRSSEDQQLGDEDDEEFDDIGSAGCQRGSTNSGGREEHISEEGRSEDSSSRYSNRASCIAQYRKSSGSVGGTGGVGLDEMNGKVVRSLDWISPSGPSKKVGEREKKSKQALIKTMKKKDHQERLKKRRMTAPEVRHYLPVFHKQSIDIDEVVSIDLFSTTHEPAFYHYLTMSEIAY
jgi:hypothetical protein